MKLFSRKGLVAATTAVAIAAGSLSAPATAADKSGASELSSTALNLFKGEANSKDTSTNSDTTTKGKGTIDQIKNVLSIISTVIAILGALFPLVSQIMKKFGK
ncbi:hypothetical protein ACQXY3_07685 [Corynebacterium diphtheriae]|uniref:hypothetical protein n=1 Tax=Corynebacterium diphtheriae TaxID=1717 RepID=UPI000246902D|nr:hypothetical protein [Corynebacterium diphtheriae]AEX81265.1 putative secreted protein [Corynebacterium diphtheriae HC04]EIK56121.1 putative secreted protein [Corynebacterium diphtheriae bv. intermedius str. NCTC 5011]MBG9246450.1 hypothetical protein [Corynebacterium diphtheriae bv. mitis]MBG9256936.1 hypothetical protein [Corynebacterium diphtheriae bv. mitis]MBG9291545.1 hypothetical protein [Corynebacterium diphtheriae bv. gravis]